MSSGALVLVAIAGAALAAWLGVLLHPARPWDLRPVGEELLEPLVPARWPDVAVVVPARNEADYLPHTVPALLAQDYPGRLRVIVVDDRSADGTGDATRALADPRLTVVTGAALPAGWAGKVWAMHQGVEEAAGAGLVLLTDADILHAPDSLRNLVATALDGDLALVSRMALLRCRTRAERLLTPPFLYFFNLLYPMRWANRPGRRFAAAAGGCVLVDPRVLAEAGGLEAIRGRVIDDVSLARLVKRTGARIQLAVSRERVTSLRAHDFGGLWRMVRRTAFVQLGRSWSLLALTVVGMALLFAVPPVAGVAGLALAGRGSGFALASGLALGAWAVMTATFVPSVRHFGAPLGWALALPVAGLLYGAMTLDSGLRSLGGRGPGWG